MLERLTINEVPENMKDIAEAIGMDAFKSLIKLSGGSNLYIPNESSIIKPIRNEMIREAFTGDYKCLSKLFGISEVQIRNIVSSRS